MAFVGSRLPLVVILGSTGTGKSKLAIEIGKRVGGEILSADSMQVYKGLDIITNKVTAEEQSQCPHHLLDFVSPLKEFSVVEFRNMALPLIDNIRKRNKVPIIVGGTNYYIESILWDILIDDDEGSVGSSSKGNEEFTGPLRAIKRRKQMQTSESLSCSEASKLEAGTCTVDSDFGRATPGERCSHVDRCDHTESGSNNDRGGLYEKLKQVDPVMADRLHPNDTRKIARSIQVFEQKGIQHSTILQEQQQRPGGSGYGGPLRYENVCVFWLQCERQVLNERLDKRVDAMLEMGLINELLDFHREYHMVRSTKDSGMLYTEGIFQSIGFKEFHEFLIKHQGREFDKSTSSEEQKTLLTNCIENMKMVTRRYAKKQVTWVKNRFLGRPCTSAPNVYGLDATDLENWDTNVLKKGLDILLRLVNGENPATEPLPRVVVNKGDRVARHVCKICSNKVILGEENWNKHLVSKSHKWHIKRERQKKEKYAGFSKQ